MNPRVRQRGSARLVICTVRLGRRVIASTSAAVRGCSGPSPSVDVWLTVSVTHSVCPAGAGRVRHWDDRRAALSRAACRLARRELPVGVDGGAARRDGTPLLAQRLVLRVQPGETGRALLVCDTFLRRGLGASHRLLAALRLGGDPGLLLALGPPCGLRALAGLALDGGALPGVAFTAR